MPDSRSATALKRLIQTSLDALEDVQDDGERLFARDVQWHELDESGCNWDMDGYRGPAGYTTQVRMIVNRLRREYQLAYS
jgi:hypothetical protein